VNAELLAAAAARNINTAGKTEREIAYEVMLAGNVDPGDTCSDHREVTIASQSDSYVIYRALRAHNEGW